MFQAVQADARRLEARRIAALPKPAVKPPRVPVLAVAKPVGVKTAPKPFAPKVDPLAASRAAFLAGLLRAKMPVAEAKAIAASMTAADLLPSAAARRKARR